MKPFQKNQLAFTEYLRKPESDIKSGEDSCRQKKIYRDLVLKNISKCIADAFPITKNIITEDNWHRMVRDFINSHRLQTPYFLEICQEFLTYLMHTRSPLATDYPFMLELMHFEWIQLAVDITDTNFPAHQQNSNPTESSLWKTSPLAVGLTYAYPVHIIDECHLPKAPNNRPTYLVVYRNRHDDLKTLEIDKLTLRIIQLLQTYENINHSKISQLLQNKIDADTKENQFENTLTILRTLEEKEIILYH